MEKRPSDKRKFKRLDVRVKVNISRYDATKGKTIPQSVVSRNISAGGLLIEFDKPVELGGFVMVKFILPFEDGKFEFIARVVRIEEIEPLRRYELGLAFVEIEPGAAKALDKYVVEELQKQSDTIQKKEQK